MNNRYWFVGGEQGSWRVTRQAAITGAPLASISRLNVVQAEAAPSVAGTRWALQGLTSNVRYATKDEVATLRSKQESPGRAGSTMAALIPIKKSARWWDLAQDERRAIFEETSHHTAIGLDYLPAIARRLHHSRDLGEPFDFLTWFEFAPQHSEAFDQLLVRLRETPEWSFVEREVEVRLLRGEIVVP
ncbi:MAG: chlorite dismutase family protein [Bryobacteraceae bacterium]|nr:chlorite dismutase family protein [Bryobacteraceae bacterium]